MNKKEPKVLTRMRLSCCWGDNLNEKELNEVVDYITYLQRENKQLKDNWNELKKWLENQIKELNPRELEISQFNIQNDDYTMGQYNVYQNILEKCKN